MSRRGWMGIVWLVVTGLASKTSGQGIIFPSAGAVHRSMAGASTAAPVDAVGATYWNPAAIAGMDDSEIFVGVDFLYADTFLESSFEPTGAFGSNRSDSGLASSPAIGVVSRPQNSTFTYGLGIYGLVGRTIDFPGSDVNPVLKPFDPPESIGLGPVAARISGLQIAPMMSKQLSDTLAVGGGAMVTSMFLGLDPALFAERNPGGLFPPATQGRSYWGFGFQGGVLYTPNELWSFGASYKSPVWFERFDYNSKDAQGNPRRISLDFKIPWVLSLGGAYRGFEDTLVAADIRYFAYSSTPFFGGEPLDSRLGWQNIMAFAIGVTRQVSEHVELQGGFSLNGNPIPEAATLFNIQIPAINQFAFSAGLTVALTERVDVIGSVMYGFPHSIQGTILEIPGTAIELRQELTTISAGLRFKL